MPTSTRFFAPNLLAFGICLAWCSLASARDFPWCPKPVWKLDETCEDGLTRAGHPDCIAWWARPSYSYQETGYYVGGGQPFHGQPRCENEGTWGWDFYFHNVPPHVQLKWSHGQQYQDGPGQYQTDGPKARLK